MRSLKTLIPAVIAVIALGSCAVSDAQIVDHTFYGETAAYTETAAPGSTVITTSGDVSSAMLPYLGDSPELPEHDEEPVHTTPAVTAAEIIETEITAREADTIPETSDAGADEEPEELPEKTAEATEHPEETAETAEQSTAPEEIPAESGVKMQSSKKVQKYKFEYQKTNGSLSILGPNLVYLGESFDFDHYYPDETEKTSLMWVMSGNIGSIDDNGVFTALKKGVCNLTLVDRTNGTFAMLKLHVIAPGDDVDFLPLVNNIPIANKTYPLPKDYAPGLDPRAKAAFMQMQLDAEKAGIHLYSISDYRSYNYQQQVYAGWKAMYGSEADLVSARPGHSEHQLGLAIDVNSLEYSFAYTAEGKWLKEHCAEYGFIIRYPSYDSKQTTGYSYEPWHIRYLGKTLAETVMSSGLTLEECLRIDSYYR
ncbi:MAG: D-alanyl-D-alanine carboxypeptidase family protein [Ruminiclostridium sp.]|nr:D-alanyl-D-alanine carboxypeptidase family protein [Ruminiclostridium sp.]